MTKLGKLAVLLGMGGYATIMLTPLAGMIFGFSVEDARPVWAVAASALGLALLIGAGMWLFEDEG